jgi:hypothetical protein
MFRWILFAWALAMTIVMLMGIFVLFLSGVHGDSALIGWALIFWAAFVLGIPGWIGVAGLTIAQRKSIQAHIIFFQNAPTVVAALLVLIFLGAMHR